MRRGGFCYNHQRQGLLTINNRTYAIPNQARGQLVVPQVALDRIVAHCISRMVDVIGDRVVDLAYQQVLAVIQSGRVFRCHVRQSIDLKSVLGLPIFAIYEIFFA
jgi:hypothetical protein